MSKFYIVDQSLVNRGGHHYDYTTCVAQAAHTMGFETIVLANKKLDAETVFPNTQVQRSFTNTVYQRDSYLAGLRHLKRAKGDLEIQSPQTGSHWHQFKKNFHHQKLQRRRSKVINQFAKDCDKAFAGVELSQSDHVFLTTVSELEMMGLAIFLRSKPATISPSWHLQFHFNIFEGRTPEYAAQSATEKLTRACFESALNRLSYHNVHCYTTSQTLADQYNRLGVSVLTSLPYPVAPEFAIATSTEHSPPIENKNRPPHFVNQPLRVSAGQTSAGEPNPQASESCSSTRGAGNPDFCVEPTAPQIKSNAPQTALRFTCPGQIRREKGCLDYLQPLVNELWTTHLAAGKVKIALQRPRRKKFRKQKIELTSPQTNDTSELSSDAIEYFDHPLGRADYIDFIKNTDCGLLFYDSHTYFSRRAGVLGELLCAGKPLIVSAGSWLARQIAEPNFQYGESLIQKAESVRVLRIEDVEYDGTNVPAAGGMVTFDRENHPFRFSLNHQNSEQLLLFRFQWKFPTEEGTFVKICMTQKNGQGNTIDSVEQIVGHRRNDRNPNCLFRINRETETIEIALSNAFSPSTASIRNISVEMLSMTAKNEPGSFPLSSVGIIAADASQLSSAVAEIVQHYDHYKSSAEEFSQHWFAAHNPLRTVAHLIANQ